MAIPLLEPLVCIPDDVRAKLSTDAANALKLLRAVTTGHLTPEVASLKVGPLSHARFLTTGMRILMLYMSEHGLGDHDAEVLKLLATWVTQVYFPLHFAIKARFRINYGPDHLLRLFCLWRQQDPLVRTATEAYLRKEAWWAHPEPLLLNLLTSTDEQDRKFAVDVIQQLRGTNTIGSQSVRIYTVPQSINLEATSIASLIDWTTETVTEPVFTASIPTEALAALLDAPLPPPPYAVHTQSCERAVKAVTEAAKSVYGWEQRHGFVKVRTKHRQKVKRLRTKKEFMEIFS